MTHTALQLVEEVVEGRDALLESLAFPRLRDDDARLGRRLERVSGQDLPVVKDALGEGLAARVGAQVGRETCDKSHETIQTTEYQAS